MKTIWKYTLEPETEIELPVLCKILKVDSQHGRAVMWAFVDPGVEREKRKFVVYGTGHDMPDNPGVYIGTFQLKGGDLVFHVFEVAL